MSETNAEKISLELMRRELVQKQLSRDITTRELSALHELDRAVDFDPFEVCFEELKIATDEITKLKSEVARLKVKVEVATEMIREAIEPDFELNESWIGRAGEFGVEQCY